MANILDIIIANKRVEIEACKMACGEVEVRTARPVVSMKKALSGSGSGIIAEFKRRSPSKGEIRPMAEVRDIVPAYEAAGAAACSVLTDTPFFGGALTDLAVARSCVRLPLLRKDFIVSRRQIAEARNYGADAVLLIAAALGRDEVVDLSGYAHALGLEVLFEIHCMAELDKFCDSIDMVGVNNRDLTTFRTDPQLSAAIVRELPAGVVKVAESGLKTPADVARLRDMGFSGFLIGEALMGSDDPGETLHRFTQALQGRG